MDTNRRQTADERLKTRAKYWPDAVTPISQLMVRIYRVGSLIHEKSMECAAAHELTFAEFEVLATLRGTKPPNELMPTELYNAVLMSSGGLTKVLHGLEKRGLIVRTDGKSDRRNKPVRLTAKGRGLAERAMADILKSAGASILSGLSQSEVERSTRLLRKLLASLEG
jgi:DNA-binding MarR family transcriptional regulator